MIQKQKPRHQRNNAFSRLFSPRFSSFALKRVLLDGALFLSVFLAPWWAFSFFAVWGFLSYDLFWEAFLATLFFDTLFGVPVTITMTLFWGIAFQYQYFFFTASLALFFALRSLKAKMRR